MRENRGMKHLNQYTPEVRERAVRMVLENQEEHPSQWKAIESVAAMFGCGSETLRRWVRRAEQAAATPGMSNEQRAQECKRLQRENAALRRTNEILRKATAFFAQAELDREAK